jgi:hypothetical protein
VLAEIGWLEDDGQGDAPVVSPPQRHLGVTSASPGRHANVTTLSPRCHQGANADVIAPSIEEKRREEKRKSYALTRVVPDRAQSAKAADGVLFDDCGSEAGSEGDSASGGPGAPARTQPARARRRTLDGDVFVRLQESRPRGLGLTQAQAAKAVRMIRGKGKDNQWSGHKLASIEYALDHPLGDQCAIVLARGHLMGKTAKLADFEALTTKWGAWLRQVQIQILGAR